MQLICQRPTEDPVTRVSATCILGALLFCFAMASSASYADEESGAAQNSCDETLHFDPVTLEDVLNTASSMAPPLLLAQQEIAIAKAGIMTAKTPFLPSANFALNEERFVNKSGTTTSTSVGNSIVGGAGNHFSNYPAVAMTWNLFNGGKDVAGYRGAQAGLIAAENTRSNQVNTTLTGTLSAYNDLFKAQLAVTQQVEDSELLRHIEARSKERFSRGRANLIDVTQAQINFADGQRKLLLACQTMIDKSSALATQMGIRAPAGHVLSISGPIPTSPSALLDWRNLDAVVQSDPGVQSAKATIEAAQQKAEQARAAFYPTLALTGRYDWLGQNPDSFAAAYHDTASNSYRIGIALQLSLGPFTSEYAALESAQASIIKAQTTYQQTVISVETRLRNAWNAKHAFNLIAHSDEQSAKQAADLLNLSQQLFSHGRVDQNTVDQAHIAADKAQEQARESESDLNLNNWLAYGTFNPIIFVPALIQRVKAANAPLSGTRIAAPKKAFAATDSVPIQTIH